MFGAQKPSFGAPTSTGAFPFGANNNTQMSSFGSSFAKPAATAGFQQTPGFSQQNTAPLFGGGQPTNSVFGVNPTPAFGAAAQPTTQAGFAGCILRK